MKITIPCVKINVMRITHRKVKIKILLTQFIAVIPFIIFIFMLFDLWYDTRRTLVLEQNLSNAKILSEYISKTISHSRGIASTLSQKEFFETLEKIGLESDKNKLKKVFKIIQQNQPELDSVSLFDPEGNLIESSFDYDPSKAAVNIGDRDYFMKTVSSKKITVSDPLIGRLSDKNIIMVTSPIIIENKLEALALIGVNLQQLKNNFETAVKTKNQRVFIIGQQGEIIMELNKPHIEDQIKNMLKENVHVLVALKGNESIIDNEKLPISNKSLLGYTVPVEGDDFHWAILSVSNTEEVYLPIIKAQSFLWVIILGSIVFVLSVISFLLKRIKIIY